MALANLAYYYVAGPVHVYVRFAPRGLGPYVAPRQLSGDIYFLGHATDSPEPDFTPQFAPVMSSLAGPIVPDDTINMGGTYAVAVELSRFNYTVLSLVKQFARHGRLAPPGSETYLDRGRLTLTQGDSFELWLKNGFYGTQNAAAYPDLPPGYYYPACQLAGYSPRQLSRNTKKAILHITPLSVRQGVTGGFLTYTQDPEYFSGLPDPG